MRKTFARAVFAPILVLAAVFCLSARQSPAPQTPDPGAGTHFQWARVSVSKQSDHEGGDIYNGQAYFQAATMQDMVAAAFNVRPEAVTGGPAWLGSQLYDLRAKGPSGASVADLRAMMQSFLQERFHLVTRVDQRPQPAYALTLIGKDEKLKPAADSDAPGACNSPPLSDAEIAALQAAAQAGHPQRRDITVDCTNETMVELAKDLPDMAPAYVDRNVLDRTGLGGGYDFPLAWIGRGQLRLPSDSDYDGSIDISLFDALRKVGLKLDPITAPQPVIVIESVEQTPIDVANSPTPPPPPMPTTFDVAAVKPFAAGSGRLMFRITPGGEVDIHGLTLAALIANAFDNNDSREVVGLPDWARKDQWDITAKTSPGVIYDDVAVMLQSLLKQRFGLAMHQETRTIPVFALRSSGHPKLTPNTNGGTSDCTNSAESGNRTLTCTNLTAAKFVQILFDRVGGYIDRPVIDSTGLTGSYDFKLTWAPIGVTGYNGAGRGAAAASSPDGQAPDPSGHMTIFTALGKELGLKLVGEKQPHAVTVIDHLDRVPTAN